MEASETQAGPQADDLAILRRIQRVVWNLLLLPASSLRNLCVENLTFKKSYPQMLPDQHPRYGWELLRHNLSDSDENWFLDQKIYMVDPKLSGRLLAQDHPKSELLKTDLEECSP